MSLITRALAGLCVVTAPLLTFAGVSAEWLYEQCTIADRFGNRISLFELQRRNEQMSRKLQVSIEHFHSKDTVAEALYRDQISLVEAAARFCSLYDDPKSWHHPHHPRPGRDDGETWCREVIDWMETKVRIEESSCRANAVRQRLEAELQQQLTYHGSVKLPE
jgi:hypothetical protein